MGHLIDYDDEATRDRIDASFAARLAIAESWPQSPIAASVGRIAIDLLEGRGSMSPELWGEIRRSTVLLASWNHMCTSLTLAELPRVAAASTGGLSRRRFDKGDVAIIRSRELDETYVKIRWLDPGSRPSRLLLQRDDALPHLRSLPVLRASGDWLLLCNDANADDRSFVALINDPRTTGLFLA
jgi:hypothetical protein